MRCGRRLAVNHEDDQPHSRGDQAQAAVPGLDQQRPSVESIIAGYDGRTVGGLRDPSAWPQDRSTAVFDQWFAPEVHSMVLDLVEEPISTFRVRAARPLLRLDIVFGLGGAWN